MTEPNRLIIPDTPWAVCVWEDEDGRVLSDGDGYLSLEGYLRDKRVEAKMEQAARYWMGSEFSGKPKWIANARKVTDAEYDDQMERMEMGKIPDPVDEWRQSMARGN